MIDIIITAFVLGVMGAGHCLGMCGGVAAALAFGIDSDSSARRMVILLSYNIGRITSYAVMGAIAAFASGHVQDLTPLPILRILSGLVLIAMGFYLAGWTRWIFLLERAGSKLWQYLSPLGKRLMPVKTIPAAFLFGTIWGWLPCGLVYSVLVYAATQVTPFNGATVMLAFGLGTIPAVLLGAVAATSVRRWLAKKIIKWSFAFAFIAYGIYTLLPVLQQLLAMMGIIQMDAAMAPHHH
ncbi:sulfite exporter TauE/SafE family protein [Teredinibacter waterburyi]|jgi:Uncharacterized conserved protein|uniref:sulfite exporter TauE/SafE family protein n=1 Tax=Teredinibacter waterburyi TaxID=1500538 RepID=UPI001FEC9094|nr:sulfite exporter TauE/SafE family protein [Teredinibacter waterburyi]